MNEIKIEIKGKSKTYRSPAAWSELGRRNFIPACMLRSGNGDPEENIREIIGISKRDFKKIPKSYIMIIYEEYFKWITEIPEYKDSKIDVVRLGLKKIRGPERQFSNITWEEFIWADTLYLRGMSDEAMAVLYRRERKGEKEPFDEKNMNANFKQIKKLPETTRLAMLINYDAMRLGVLEKKYKNLFPPRMTKQQFDSLSEEEKKRRLEKDKSDSFSWMEVHTAIMGDNYYMADKYMKTKLSTVLDHIDRTIAEQKQTKK